MKQAYLFRAAMAGAAALALLQACNREPDFLSQGPATQVFADQVLRPADAAAARRWYEAGGARPALLIRWDSARVVRTGNEEHLLVPIGDTYDRFAASPYRAYRRLVVRQRNGQPVNGAIVELLVERSKPAPDLEQVFHELYRGQDASQRFAPPALTGAAFLYTADYTYLTGYRFADGRAAARSAWLDMRPAAAPAKPGRAKLGVVANDAEQGPGPGFPGNPNPYPLDPVTVTPPPPPQPPPPGPGPTPPPSGPSYPPSDGGGGGGWGGSGASSLSNQLITNPLALLQPCPGLTDAWRPLLNYTPPSSVMNRLDNLTAQEKSAVLLYAPNEPVTIEGDTWQIQSIRSAGGVAINFDYFAITVDELPLGFNSPEDLLRYMRLNLNDNVNTYLSSFQPNPLLPGEGALWSSYNPLGSIVSIGIPGNSGSVIVSDYAPNHWTFSTIHDPLNGDHPVSGNRQFGFVPSGSGYTFYIQGTDRIDQRYAELLGSFTRPPVPFLAADALWESWQSKFSGFINNAGGRASIKPPITNRPDWNKVLDALRNNKPLSTVPCP